MSTEMKLRDMTPGQTVTIPTEGSGNHTGVLVRFAPRGPLADKAAVVAIYRDADGEEVRVPTRLSFTGWAADPEFEVRTIWEGELIASIDCPDEATAWADFRESTSEDDGYTVQIVHDGRILAEQTNPDENGEI